MSAVLDDICGVGYSVHNARGWDGLLWDGCEVAILASGESLSIEQCDAVNRWRDASRETRKVITINTSFRRARWADVLYACDGDWWRAKDKPSDPTYYEEARATFAGTLWTQDLDAAKEFGLRHIASQRNPIQGLSTTLGVVYQGSNGGYQTIGLAYWAGVRFVYLIGYDMRGGHWHGNHPGKLNKVNRFDMFLQSFAKLSNDVELVDGFDVINCTPGGMLNCFPRRDWREVFACP